MQNARLERWALKAEAERLLGGQFERIGRCCRYRLGEHVEVWYSTARGQASYGKLETCGSVWCCPVCAAKVSERRRAELVTAVNHWRQEGHSVALMSLTFPHGAGDALEGILGAFLKAYRRLTGHRSYRELTKRVGLVGSIRALEVTNGRNGWHPHAHVLLFLDGRIDLEALEGEVYPLWVKACQLAGLPAPSREHGVDIRNGDYAAKYASKWGLESELTKGMQKRGRGGNRSPWDLLRDSLRDDERAGGLFWAYAKAFRGKKQLVWSKGLRAQLGLVVEEKDDAELAAQVEVDQMDAMAQLDADQWRIVLRAKARAQLLEVVRTGGAEAMYQFVAWLGEVRGRRRPAPDENVTESTGGISP